MISAEKAFSCTACDICLEEKEAELLCTFIVDAHDPSKVEKVCWCVCPDCLPILEHIDSYYEEAGR